MSKTTKESELDKTTTSRTEEPRRCTYCGSEASLVWVHGHGQCANCGINVEECCRGEKN